MTDVNFLYGQSTDLSELSTQSLSLSSKLELCKSYTNVIVRKLSRKPTVANDIIVKKFLAAILIGLAAFALPLRSALIGLMVVDILLALTLAFDRLWWSRLIIHPDTSGALAVTTEKMRRGVFSALGSLQSELRKHEAVPWPAVFQGGSQQVLLIGSSQAWGAGAPSLDKTHL